MGTADVSGDSDSGRPTFTANLRHAAASDTRRLRHEPVTSRRVLAVVFAIMLAWSLGCARTTPVPRSHAAEPASEPATKLPFIEDNFAKAKAEAERTGRPLFVDAWAPWCHTCLSMRAGTLEDRELLRARVPSGKPLRDAFVWLSIDTEKPENAAFVARFPNRVWPTLYVLSPDGENVRLSWGGSASPQELIELLADIEGGAERSRFAEGVAHMASGRNAEATRVMEALAEDPRAPVGARARAVEALVTLREKDHEGLVLLAKRHLAWMPPSSSRAAVLAASLSALDALRTSDAMLVATATKDAGDPAATYVPDDRSGLFEALVSHHATLGRDDAKVECASRWAVFLAKTAAAAATKAERFVYDAHRLLAAEVLGQVGAVLPVLEASARDFPNDGNAHARVAKALSLLGRETEALAAARRAADLLQGPRALRAATLLADVLERAKRRGEAADALDAALKKVEGLPLTASQKRLADSCRARSKSLRTP